METSLTEQLIMLEYRTLGVSGTSVYMSQGPIRAFLWWFRIDEHSMVSCVFGFVLSYLAWIHMYVLSFFSNMLIKLHLCYYNTLS